MESESEALIAKLVNSKEPFDNVSVPNFLKKTYEILQSNEFGDLICWSEDGRAVVIKQPADFAQKVLPKYFKHSNLSSYIRQLNMYNFRKKKTSNLECFVHDNFQRDRSDLLSKIKRKKCEPSLSSTPLMQNCKKASKAQKGLTNGQENERLMEENRMLKKLQVDLAQKLLETERKVIDLSSQHQSLSMRLQSWILKVSMQTQTTQNAFKEQIQQKIEFDPLTSFQTSPQTQPLYPWNSESSLGLQVMNLPWAYHMPQTNCLMPTLLPTPTNL